MRFASTTNTQLLPRLLMCEWAISRPHCVPMVQPSQLQPRANPAAAFRWRWGSFFFAPTLQRPNPNPWNILHYYGGDVPADQDPIAAADRSGFGATLFERGGEKVLALRGTEPGLDRAVDLFQADLGVIGRLSK